MKYICIILLFSIGSCLGISFGRGVLSAGNQTKVTEDGIVGTRSLPPLGSGYTTYSFLGSALGRQYAHHLVITTLEDGFRKLYEETGHSFHVAEIGFRTGGKFLPHATHRTGMSVDIITPMKIGNEPAHLSLNLFNLWGYCYHIDEKTFRLKGLNWDGNKMKLCPTLEWESDKEVDFDLLKKMIVTLHKTAKKHGGKIKYVIVDPTFKRHLKIPGIRITDDAWIHHDDHVHVEFSF